MVLTNWKSLNDRNASNKVRTGTGSNSAVRGPMDPFHPRQFMRDARPSDYERDPAFRVAERAGRLAGLARLSPCRQGTV